MLYKPRFCCECGEKIEKTDWGLLDSRRFCAVCSSIHGLHDHIGRAIIGLGLLGVVFGIGSGLVGSNYAGQARVSGFAERPEQAVPQATLRPAKPNVKKAAVPEASQNSDGGEISQAVNVSRRLRRGCRRDRTKRSSHPHIAER